MPCSTNSHAKASASLFLAPCAAVYGVLNLYGLCSYLFSSVKNVAIVIILEPLSITLSPWIDVQKVPVRWIATQSLKSLKDALVKVFTGPETPALFTMISTLPNSCLIFENISLMPFSSETSTPEKDLTVPDDPTFFIISTRISVVLSNGSFLLPSIMILAPLSANFLAIAWPIPVPLPVITTILSENFKSGVFKDSAIIILAHSIRL